MIFCARATRGLINKEVKVEAQVEQRSIRLGVFSTLNLDLSLDLPMGRAQWRLNQTDQIDQPRVSLVPPVSSLWSVWSVSFVWLNQTNQTDQRNQMDQIDQTNQIDQKDQPRVSLVPLFPSASNPEPRT